jgi:hypothetical protein
MDFSLLDDGSSIDPATLQAVVIREPILPSGKIAFIKFIRSFSGISLVKAKELSETAPPILLCFCTPPAAEMFMNFAAQAFEQPDLFEILHADCSIRPFLPQVVTPPLLNAAANATGLGCASQTVAMLSIGVLLYFVLF